MKADIFYLLAVHLVIWLVQFSLVKMFPSQKRAAKGVYFILLPVGFLFFAELPPLIPAIMVLAGVYYVFYAAAGAADSDKEQEALKTNEV